MLGSFADRGLFACCVVVVRGRGVENTRRISDGPGPCGSLATHSDVGLRRGIFAWLVSRETRRQIRVPLVRPHLPSGRC